jgi:ABC-2 type transport system permease protein
VTGALARSSAVLRQEWRLFWRDPAVWAVLLVLCASVVYALANGQRQTRQHQELVLSAKADESARITAAQAQLADIDAGRVKPPSEPFQDPRNAIFVGGGRAAAAVDLPLLPLAPVAVGLRDLLPPVLLVSAASKDSFLFKDEIANPMHLLSGWFDLAFVLVFIYPLCLLLLTYNLVSLEREQGRLGLVASCGHPMGLWLLLRLAVRGGLPVVAVLAMVLVCLAAFGVNLAADLPATWLLCVAVLGYGLFWLGLSLCVGMFGRSSAWNAMASVGVWIVMLLILPAATHAIAGALYPAPSRASLVLQVRAAAVDAESNRDAELAKYLESHPQTDVSLDPGSARERTLRRLVTQQAAVQRVDALLLEHEAQLARQQAVVQRFSVVSPALLMNEVLAEVAGSGPQRMAEFMAMVNEFHGRWRAFFVSRAQVNQPMSVQDYRQLPRWAANPQRSAAGLSAVLQPLWRLAGLSVLVLACAALMLRRFKVS